MTLTIDASVIGDLMFQGPRTAAAKAWLDCGQQLIAPAVLEAEVLAIATRRHRACGTDADFLRRRWEVGREVPVERVAIAAFADDAFELAIQLRHPSTDCLYLATAITRDAPLVTGDRRLYDTAVATGLGAHVRWVEDPPS